MDEYDEIFFDYTDATELGPDPVIYEMARDGSGMGLDRSQTDTPVGRISTLSELFLEWYLFDASKEKDIKTFLTKEKIQDVFTEAEFMDLMCGMAYLDDDLLQFVLLKLPFLMFHDKLHGMNAKVAKSKKAYKIESPSNIGDKIKELEQQKERAKKDKRNARERKRYAENPEENRAKNRGQKNAEHCRRWYHNNLDSRHAYDKKRRTENKEARAEVQRRAVSKKPEHYKKYKHAWYEDNKPELQEKQKQRLLELKQLSKSALRICAAYVFLKNLRKTDLKKYLELYTRQQKPLIHMLKTCIALQNMDINMCPFCNPECGFLPEQCCNQKVLNLAGAQDELHTVGEELRKKEEKRIYRHNYYLTHKDQEREQNQQWILDHPEQHKEYQKGYRTEHATDISVGKKKCYQANPEKYQQTTSKYYQAHKSDIAEAGKKYRDRVKQQCESAKKVCAAYVFLVNLKEKDRKKYLELYTKRQNPLTHMLKTCVALQNMDMNMCPFCNSESGVSPKRCCNQKVLALPNAIEKIQAIAGTLMQNGVQNGR